ncbi:endonuclease V [Amycolatopsis sp. FDAARGOS 1241]|uniref:endonuclease V n=1 Tax=Amycolatopsis sp. FDAARGOS 1241 TaxID=2778070 RepID=UPI0019501E36|nr:endonuclease V [Amycolatopsis sp. FDAARGOS 1241]QRP47071.1 endonuclease V [Amycolatopsis sp. FDAARGOS 1241]
MRWSGTVPEGSELTEVQDRLRGEVDLTDACPHPATVTGLDVAYDPAGPRIAAAAVTLALDDLRVIEERVVTGEVTFPYEPGLFAFRELPPLLDAVGALAHPPEVFACDGHGLAHPRRFGLACHLGVLTATPAFGVGKARLVGAHAEPGPERGDTAPLLDGDEQVGAVLRTQRGVKPVYVSAGHLISLGHACRLTLALASRYRLPETTRAADHLCRAALAGC